jgi:Protein of unknown function (DUF2491)
MKHPRPSRPLRLALICLTLLVAEPLSGLVSPWLTPVAEIVAVAPPAAAQTSGGYRRPGGGGFSGGFGGGGYSSSYARRPSVGGGYSRPSSSAYGGGFGGVFGGGDVAISRRNSSQALRDYRASQQRQEYTTRRPSSGWDDSTWQTAPLGRRPLPGGWGGGYAPGYPSYPVSTPRFGAWDALLAWSLLNSLSRPQAATYFQDYRNDPGYAQWRAEADRKAQSDPAVAQKLAELDGLMGQAKAQPAAPRARPADSSGGGWLFIVIVVGGAILLVLWLMRRRAAAVAGGGSTAMAPGLSGSARSRFRVGMTLPVDPSPFVLAAGMTKVKPLEEGGMISVEAVGLVNDGGVAFHRLYLPGGEAFFMLHLGRDGGPDECRYFTLLDRITPASRDEWAFWLDPAEGMIGWPQFETKDGKTYDRVWAPGSSRVQPRQQIETLQGTTGTIERKIQAILYGARTGAAPPAPATEYVLVCAVEQGDEAWIEVYAGIDINPAALTLPAVPLDS